MEKVQGNHQESVGLDMTSKAGDVETQNKASLQNLKLFLGKYVGANFAPFECHYFVGYHSKT
ncbi:hypothetical protein BZZ01_09210 [Nostocales cyanobacterium HT-58-2]|nr:hypothetical protein BZZ01_09210 [Nostocales cyanobacterium HT-58-2]